MTAPSSRRVGHEWSLQTASKALPAFEEVVTTVRQHSRSSIFMEMIVIDLSLGECNLCLVEESCPGRIEVNAVRISLTACRSMSVCTEKRLHGATAPDEVGLSMRLNYS